MSDFMSQSYHDVMELYKRPMSVRYIPTFFWAIVSVISLSLAFPQSLMLMYQYYMYRFHNGQMIGQYALWIFQTQNVTGMYNRQTIHLVRDSIGRQLLGLM